MNRFSLRFPKQIRKRYVSWFALLQEWKILPEQQDILSSKRIENISPRALQAFVPSVLPPVRRETGRRLRVARTFRLLDCPMHNAARSRFSLTSGFEFSPSLPSVVEDLAPILIFVRNDSQLAGQLAKFTLNIRSTRRHHFRHLGTDGQSGRRTVALRVVFERWRDGMSQPAKYVAFSFYGTHS